MKIESKTHPLLSFVTAALAAAMLVAAPQVSAMPGIPAAAIQSSQSVSDDDLEDKVRGALGATMGKPAHEIGVSARDGTVMLFGAVRSPSLRDRAARATRHVFGVRTVVNALTVVRGS